MGFVPMSSAKIKMMCGGLLTSVSIKIVNTITDNTIVAITPSTNKRDRMKIPLFFMVSKRSVRERKSPPLPCVDRKHKKTAAVSSSFCCSFAN